MSEIQWKLIYKEKEKQHNVFGNVYAFIITTHIYNENKPHIITVDYVETNLLNSNK